MEFSQLRGEKAKPGTDCVWFEQLSLELLLGPRYCYQFPWQMTGCCRNGGWPSRGQDNNLPAIYCSSSFSDRKKVAKNTPCIFMVCVVTLGSRIVPPPAQSRVHAEVRPGYSGFWPIRSGEFPKLEILQPFYVSLFQCLPHPMVKRLFLVSSWNFPHFIVLDSGVPGVSVAIALCFSPRKIPLMGAAPAASMVLAAVSLQFPSSISWEISFSFASWGLEIPWCCAWGINR